MAGQVPKRPQSGRPSLFSGARQRTINLTDEAFAKAEADAKALSDREGFRVSISQAIETAIRSFRSPKGK
jgi:hypothetical protein